MSMFRIANHQRQAHRLATTLYLRNVGLRNVKGFGQVALAQLGKGSRRGLVDKHQWLQQNSTFFLRRTFGAAYINQGLRWSSVSLTGQEFASDHQTADRV